MDMATNSLSTQRIRLEVKNSNLDQIETQLRQGEVYSLNLHKVIENAEPDVLKAIRMIADNVKDFSDGASSAAFDTLHRMAKRYPAHALHVARAFIEIDSPEALNSLGDMKLNKDDPATSNAVIDLIAETGSDCGIVSKLAVKHPKSVPHALDVLSRIGTAAAGKSALDLVGTNSRHVANVLANVVASEKPSAAAISLMLYNADRSRALPVGTFIDALAAIGTDEAIKGIGSIGKKEARNPERAMIALTALHKTGTKQAVKMMAACAAPGPHCILAAEALFAAREKARNQGNDPAEYDGSIRDVLDKVISYERIEGMLDYAEGLRGVFAKADNQKIAPWSYSGLFNEAVAHIRQGQEIRARIAQIQQQPPEI